MKLRNIWAVGGVHRGRPPQIHHWHAFVDDGL